MAYSPFHNPLLTTWIQDHSVLLVGLLVAAAAVSAAVALWEDRQRARNAKPLPVRIDTSDNL